MLKYVVVLLLLTGGLYATDVTDNASERTPDPVALGTTSGDGVAIDLVQASIEESNDCNDIVAVYIKNHTTVKDQEQWEKDFNDHVTTKVNDNPNLSENSAANEILYCKLISLAFKKLDDYTDEDVLMIFRFVKIFKEKGFDLPKVMRDNLNSDSLTRLAYGRW